jgi:hypothetical protein
MKFDNNFTMDVHCDFYYRMKRRIGFMAFHRQQLTPRHLTARQFGNFNHEKKKNLDVEFFIFRILLIKIPFERAQTLICMQRNYEEIKTIKPVIFEYS